MSSIRYLIHTKRSPRGKFFPSRLPLSYHKQNETGPVAQSVERPLRGTGGHGFDPGPRHTKVVKIVLAAPHLTLRPRTGRPSVRIMRLGVVWGHDTSVSSTIEVSIELLVATRHRRDMTENC